MKVICIKRAAVKESNSLPDGPDIGDIDTVILVVNCPEGDYYELERFAKKALYAARNFATLPGLTETDREEILEQAEDSILV